MANKIYSTILKKISQAVNNQMSTDEVNKNNSVSGNPPSFIATNNYPSLITAFDAKNLPWINQLSNVLNDSLYYCSNGQINLNWMKSNNFNSDNTQIPSTDLKKIMSFCKIIYNYLYTDLGQNYQKPLSSQQVADKIKFIYNSQPLNTLPSVMNSGQLATKIGGNLKTIIQNYLLQIK